MRETEGLYIISVAARLLEMHQQTLRKYERAGFIRPQRTVGNLRLYSVEDVERLRQIKYLVDVLGMNLDGVESMLALTHRLRRLHRSIAADLTLDDVDVVRNEISQMLALLGTEPEGDVQPGVANVGDRRAR